MKLQAYSQQFYRKMDSGTDYFLWICGIFKKEHSFKFTAFFRTVIGVRRYHYDTSLVTGMCLSKDCLLFDITCSHPFPWCCQQFTGALETIHFVKETVFLSHSTNCSHPLYQADCCCFKKI